MKSSIVLAAILTFLASTANGSVIRLSAIREDATQILATLIVVREESSSTISISPTPTPAIMETNPTETSPAPMSTFAPPPTPPSKPSASFTTKDAILLCVGLVVFGILIPILHRLYKIFLTKQYEPITLLHPTVIELRECWREKEVLKMREAQNFDPTDAELQWNWEMNGKRWRENEEYRLKKREKDRRAGRVGLLDYIF